MTVEIKQLPNADLERIAEIDRSEHVTLGYEMEEGVLVAKTVDWDIPNWSRDPSSDFSVRAQIDQWAPILERDGVLLGAFERSRLAGLAILRYHLSDDMAQLAFLHVSNGHRRKGVGSELTREVIRLAKASGARRLYVSSVPSESAVGFYRSRGFEPTQEVHPELFDLEPEDIHMIKQL